MAQATEAKWRSSGCIGHVFCEEDVERIRTAAIGDRYFRFLRELGVESPVFLLLSLVGVGGYRMLQQGGPRGYYLKLRQVDRDFLLVPEVMVESLEQNLQDLQQRMRPLLDAVWNAVGAPHSPHYDESGNWQSRR